MSKVNKLFFSRTKGLSKANPVFWGWYVVTSSFVMLTLIYGARYSFGIFVKPMFAEYDWSMTLISLAASINLLMYASAGVFAGWLLDRVAPKWITTVSVLFTAAGFVAASFITSPLGLYLCYGVLVGIGSAGSGAVACTASIGKWFIKKEGPRHRHCCHGYRTGYDGNGAAGRLYREKLRVAGRIPVYRCPDMCCRYNHVADIYGKRLS